MLSESPPARFSAISGAVGGISVWMLSHRLVELEDLGLVDRTVDAKRRPVLVEYVTTQMAQELSPVFDALQEWADEGMAPRVEV